VWALLLAGGLLTAGVLKGIYLASVVFGPRIGLRADVVLYGLIAFAEVVLGFWLLVVPRGRKTTAQVIALGFTGALVATALQGDLMSRESMCRCLGIIEMQRVYGVLLQAAAITLASLLWIGLEEEGTGRTTAASP